MLRFFIRLFVVLSIMEDVRRSHTVISVRGPLVDVFFSSSGSQWRDDTLEDRIVQNYGGRLVALVYLLLLIGISVKHSPTAE